MAFAGQDPGFQCLDAAGDVISNSSMTNARDLNATQHCHKLIFDNTIKTVVSEWSLVCDRAWMVAMITTVQNIGVLIGYLTAGHAADHIGRKPVFFSAVSIMVIFNFVAYFSVSWIIFAVVRFCIGFGAAFFFPVRDNMMIEVASPKWRPILIGIPSFALFAAFLGLLAWLLKDWQSLHLAIGCFGLPILLTWWAVAAGSFGMASTTGSIVAPQIVFLNNKVHGVLYLSCGILMLITSMLIPLCKETKDMPLNDTLAAGSNTVDPQNTVQQ